MKNFHNPESLLAASNAPILHRKTTFFKGGISGTLMVMACTAVYLSRNSRSDSVILSPSSNGESVLISRLISLSSRPNGTIASDKSTTVVLQPSLNLTEDIDYDSWETFQDGDNDTDYLDEKKLSLPRSGDENDANCQRKLKVKEVTFSDFLMKDGGEIHRAAIKVLKHHTWTDGFHLSLFY